MTVRTDDDVRPRPASPWRRSEHQTRHRRQLDPVTTADAIAAAGGRLISADDGFLHVGYDRPEQR